MKARLARLQLRGDRGQGALEYIGILAVVALVITIALGAFQAASGDIEGGLGTLISDVLDGERADRSPQGGAADGGTALLRHPNLSRDAVEPHSTESHHRAARSPPCRSAPGAPNPPPVGCTGTTAS
jgi:hypothetical protein